MNLLKGAAVVGQSGGPTAAINATLAGVIRAAISDENRRGGITKLYGMKNGIEGFLAERMIDLSSEFTKDGAPDEDKLALLAATPAAALGSCRKKLPDPTKDTAVFDDLLDLFKKYDIRYFFYIGGNDSMDTVSKLTAYLKTRDYEMRVVGLPKTIDNDLLGTDHTPGYGSAAKYVAVTMQEIVRDCAVYEVPAVTIVEIMGRDAGWLTAAAALPRTVNGSAPDYVYLPERVFSLENFFEDIEAAFKKHPNVVVAVSEGICYADGTSVGATAQSGATDVFGHKYLAGVGKALEREVKNKFGCKVRSIELSLNQRCASHIASKTDIDESLEVGASGVCAALNGESGCMMTIVREASESGEYFASYKSSLIDGIANQTKSVPAEYINERGNDVTDECLSYIKPLIKGEAEQKFIDGLPCHIILNR